MRDRSHKNGHQGPKLQGRSAVIDPRQPAGTANPTFQHPKRCSMSGHELSEDEIYAQNLLSKNCFAPWMCDPVNIAEIGYVANGKWV